MNEKKNVYRDLKTTFATFSKSFSWLSIQASECVVQIVKNTCSSVINTIDCGRIVVVYKITTYFYLQLTIEIFNRHDYYKIQLDFTSTTFKTNVYDIWIKILILVVINFTSNEKKPNT